MTGPETLDVARDAIWTIVIVSSPLMVVGLVVGVVVSLFQALTQIQEMTLSFVPKVVAMSIALVLALPRGGVPVAFEVAQRLGLELDILVVRKLGTPGNRELAMGAIASGGVRVMNEDIVRYVHASRAEIDGTIAQESHELQRREQAYRGDRPRPVVAGRAVILVDDGLATGATMRAAVKAVRQLEPSSITVAVPVAAPDSVAQLEPLADRIICLHMPHDLYAIGRWYQNFDQTPDRLVVDLLQRAWSRGGQPA